MNFEHTNNHFLPSDVNIDSIIKDLVKYEVVFTGLSADFCVCIVDIVNSTATTANICDKSKVRFFYSIFINAISFIVPRFNGKIIKNVGDSLIFFFPKTCNITSSSNKESKKTALTDVLECGHSILGLRQVINSFYGDLGLEPVSFRISADYGRLEVAKLPDGGDLFGPTMNLCAKINEKAPPNSMVVGGDLYFLMRQISNYLSNSNVFHAHEIDEYSIRGFKQRYPIYLVGSLISGSRIPSSSFPLLPGSVPSATSAKWTSLAEKLEGHLSRIIHPNYDRL
jgi:two-component system, OmpR family, response regulator ChvI